MADLRHLRGHFRRALFLICLGMHLSGCVHYHFGNRGTLPFSSVYVAPPEGDAEEPTVLGLLWEQVAMALENCPAVRLEPHEAAADATLTVTLSPMSAWAAARSPQDTAVAEIQTLTLNASCSLHDNRTGHLYFSAVPVSASMDLRNDVHFIDRKYQSMPELARTLALRIRNLLFLIRRDAADQ